MHRTCLLSCTLLIAYVLPLAGCNTRMPTAIDVEGKKAARKQAAIERKSKAGERFLAFLDEAQKGADLLETFPTPEKLADEVSKLKELAGTAGDVANESDFEQACVREAQSIVKFFSVSLANVRNLAARAQATDQDREGVKSALGSNAAIARKAVDRMREELKKGS